MSEMVFLATKSLRISGYHWLRNLVSVFSNSNLTSLRKSFVETGPFILKINKSSAKISKIVRIFGTQD